jgi:hypothetical protein
MLSHNTGLLVAAQQGEMLTRTTNDHLKGDTGLMVSSPSESLAPTATFQTERTRRIVLTDIEMACCRLIGKTRDNESVKRNSKENEGHDPNRSLYDHIMGAYCEAAYAKYKNVFYMGHVNVYGVPDVDGVYVRGVTFKDNGWTPEMPLRRSDEKKAPENSIWVCVLYMPDNTFKMAGWMYFKDRKKGTWKNPGDRPNGHAWFTKITDMNKMEFLP